jgi:hypothetical protein
MKIENSIIEDRDISPVLGRARTPLRPEGSVSGLLASGSPSARNAPSFSDNSGNSAVKRFTHFSPVISRFHAILRDISPKNIYRAISRENPRFFMVSGPRFMPFHQRVSSLSAAPTRPTSPMLRKTVDCSGNSGFVSLIPHSAFRAPHLTTFPSASAGGLDSKTIN